MQILFRVNENEAIRRGVDVAGSTVKVQVDPAQLTQEERDVLAVLVDSGDATQRGLSVAHDSLRAAKPGYAGVTWPIYLAQADLAGVKEGIKNVMLERDQQRAELAKKWEAARKKLDEFMANPGTSNRSVYANRDGTRTESSPWFYSTEVEVVDTWFNDSELSESDKKRYAQWKEAKTQENSERKEAAIQAALPEIKKMVKAEAEQKAAAEKRDAENKAKAAAEKAKADTERAEMIARLPELFRQRIEAGFAGKDEIDLAIKKMARADAGLLHEPFKDCRPLETLTDEEFAVFTKVKSSIAKRLPDALVEPMLVADRFESYREADEDDDPDDIDDDGDVKIEALNVRRRIMVTWHRAGLRIRSSLMFQEI